MHVCMHVCMYVCMHACMDVCMYVCMHVCLYVSFLSQTLAIHRAIYQGTNKQCNSLSNRLRERTILIPFNHYHPLTNIETLIYGYVFEMSISYFLILAFVITWLLLDETYPPLGSSFWLNFNWFLLVDSMLNVSKISLTKSHVQSSLISDYWKKRYVPLCLDILLSQKI